MLGYDRPLFMLAFDHRGSFQKTFFGVQGKPSAEDEAKIRDAKRLIWEGMLAALAEGLPREGAGILVDERSGAEVAREAKDQGVALAMPVERSGQDEFDLEYGEAFGEHIGSFDPDFAKVLVRYNPEGDSQMNARQADRLKRLGDWLHARDRKFLFELLVPATPAQLGAVEGDPARYDTGLRPGLMRRTIEELQNAGVEPDVWKIEGMDRREDCAAIADIARAGGRDGVGCIVLGRGADDDAVDRWLRAGSGVPGYLGFAIGRSIWWAPLRGYVDGDLSRESAAKAIGANHRRFVDVYRAG